MTTQISTTTTDTAPASLPTLDRDTLAHVSGGEAAHTAGVIGRFFNGLVAHSPVGRDVQDTARRVAQSTAAFKRGDGKGAVKGAIAAGIDHAKTVADFLILPMHGLL